MWRVKDLMVDKIWLNLMTSMNTIHAVQGFEASLKLSQGQGSCITHHVRVHVCVYVCV